MLTLKMGIPSALEVRSLTVYCCRYSIHGSVVSPAQFEGRPVEDSSEMTVTSAKQKITSKHTLAAIHTVPGDRRPVCVMRTEARLCANIAVT